MQCFLSHLTSHSSHGRTAPLSGQLTALVFALLAGVYFPAMTDEPDPESLFINPPDNSHTHSDISLIYAAANGFEGYVRLLIAEGAHHDMQDANGLTALMAASRSGHTNVVRLLLELGANVNRCTSDGMNALMMAARNNRLEAAKLLLRAGSRVDVRDNMGATPLIWAAVGGGPEVAGYLIECGAEIEAVSRTGLTALDCAHMGGKQDTLVVLINAILSEKGISYAGGDGSSIDEAVIVLGVRNEEDCVRAECLWIMKHRPGWRIRERIGLGGEQNGFYDQLICGNPDSCRTLYFQVNEVFISGRRREAP